MNVHTARGIDDTLSAIFGDDYSRTDEPTAELPLEIGDVTSLLIGGPEMVVISTCECGTVEVAWVDSDGDVNVDVFPEEALV